MRRFGIPVAKGVGKRSPLSSNIMGPSVENSRSSPEFGTFLISKIAGHLPI